MYSQFFGNYLLNKQAVPIEQLLKAIEEQHTKHIKLGTLAIHTGLMNADQVDAIVIRQTHEDKRFGELAIEAGYLTSEQVDSLLAQQTPDYLLIGQYLVDNGCLTNSQLEDLIKSYHEENAISELEGARKQRDNLNTLIRNLFIISNADTPDYLIKYITLLLNNLIRFIGEDFTPLAPSIRSEYVTTQCSTQIVDGAFSLTSFLDTDSATAIAFASRYAGDTFMTCDEYVRASIEDFLNLHNGLFSVNISNEDSVELVLTPPTSMENTMITSVSNMVLLPILYPFGTLNFVIKL